MIQGVSEPRNEPVVAVVDSRVAGSSEAISAVRDSAGFEGFAARLQHDSVHAAVAPSALVDAATDSVAAQLAQQ